MKRITVLTLLLFAVLSLCGQQVNFVFMSDTHYGGSRQFRGEEVTVADLCMVMADSVMSLPNVTYPNDKGVGAGEKIGNIDFVVCGGDLGNRSNYGVPSATVLWEQFSSAWLREGMPEFYGIPGNHDISNAIGYLSPLEPAHDATIVMQLYNRMMRPDTPRTLETFNNATDRIASSFILGGMRFAFAGIWLETQAREALHKQLAETPDVPCLLFSHIPPEAGTSRFTNPHDDHRIDRKYGWENVIADICSVDSTNQVPVEDYRKVEKFIAGHPSIIGWFHGHNNYNEFYKWEGVDGTVSLPMFRVDSPLKGRYSSKDESLLSFHVVAVDTSKRSMTVREYRWNDGNHWGESITITY